MTDLLEKKEINAENQLITPPTYSKNEKRLWSYIPHIPQRYVMGIIGLLGVCNALTMRVCLNVAITQMVNNTHTKESNNTQYDPDACPDESLTSTNGTNYHGTNPHAIFDWSESTQGLILSSFYYGYTTTQVAGGYLAERYGGKWPLGIGLLSTALFTFLTPIVVRVGGAYCLFILRVIQGMGEGPTMPALMIMLARWAPPQERAMLGALVFGGAQIGNIFGSCMSGVLLADNRDWAYVFYFFGGFGLIWFVLWILSSHGIYNKAPASPSPVFLLLLLNFAYSFSLLCYSTPDTHPYISEKELNYLNEVIIIADKKSKRDPVPWKAILRSPAIWALVFGMIGHDWGYYSMVTDLPKYTTDVLKFNIATTGILTSLPYIAMWAISFVFGFVCDLCIDRGWHSIKTGRIIHTTIASVGPAVFIILASYSGCDRNIAVVYFVTSMALMGGFYSGVKVNALDLAPNYAGSITAMVNSTSAVTGIIAPYLIGLLTPDSTLQQWRIAFWVCFAVLVGTNVVYAIWADGEQQWWDDVRKYGYPDGWTHGPLVPVDTEDPDVCTENKIDKK